VVGVAGWAWSTHATVSASQQQTLSGTGARVYTRKSLHTWLAGRGDGYLLNPYHRSSNS